MVQQRLVSSTHPLAVKSLVIGNKLPATLYKEYRSLWTEAIALARRHLAWLTGATQKPNDEDPSGTSLDNESQSMIDYCVRSFLLVHSACLEIRNAADVLGRLEVEPCLLQEAAFARRASIKLHNDLKKTGAGNKLYKRCFAKDFLAAIEEQDQVRKGLYMAFDRAFSKEAEEEIPAVPSADLKSRQKDLSLQLKSDIANCSWPTLELTEAEVAGLPSKCIAKLFNQDRGAYEFKLKPSVLEQFMNKATDDAVRERVYKAHLDPLLAIGYNHSYKWYKLQSEARASENLGDELVSGTGLHSCAELLDLFAELNRGTMDSLLSETARIRACVDGSSSPEGLVEQFQSWQTEWYTARYEAQTNGKLGVSAASIRCCEWPQVLDGLMNLAGGLFGCRFARDDTTPDGQAANAAFEIWHVYDTLEGDEQGAELGRIFIDFATKRRSGGSHSNTSRFMPVLTPAPLGSPKAPQVLWTVSQPVTRFSITGVRMLASDLGRIMETLFALAIDSTYTPPALQDVSQPSLSARIMGDLSFDAKTLDGMLNPAARAQGMGKKIRRSVLMSLTQWTRSFFAETHALVAAAHAFDVDRSLSENDFIKSHADAAASWGTHVPLSCRLPQTIMRDGQSWPGLVRRSCLNISNQVLAAQFLASVLPGGLEAGFDQDLVGHYRQYLQHQFGTNREGSRRSLLNVIGGFLNAEAHSRRFASDLKVFDEEEDERARVLRPIVLRLIKRRAERKQGTLVAERV